MAVKGQKGKPVAAPVNVYRSLDSIMLAIPASASATSQGIADYIVSKIKTEKDKARAIFSWLGQNIDYDVENRFAINLREKDEKPTITERVLLTRKGVCQHYAELFTEIADKIGLKSYVVTGYVKSESYQGHAWNIVRIDSVWYGIESTWGAGHVRNGRYVRQAEDKFFMMKPEEMVKTHMPFDPLWQMQSYIITGKEFYEGKFLPKDQKPFFNFKDSLKNYDQQHNIPRLEAVAKRIERNGVLNSMTYDVLQYTQRELVYWKNKEATDNYNAAVKFYNSSVSLYNSFIEYRNKQFTPKVPDEDIKKMVDIIENTLNTSRRYLATMKYAETLLEGANPDELNNWLADLAKNVTKQKEFVEKYCKTGKAFRKPLFYTFNWSKN